MTAHNASSVSAFPSRRERSRLSTSLPARIVTLEGYHSVVLSDISITGARFELSENEDLMSVLEPGDTLLLQWQGFERIGLIVWAHSAQAGIVFDDLLTPREIIATRDHQDAFVGKGGLKQHETNNARAWYERRRAF